MFVLLKEYLGFMDEHTLAPAGWDDLLIAVRLALGQPQCGGECIFNVHPSQKMMMDMTVFPPMKI